MNQFEQKRQRRVDRLQNAAANAQSNAQRLNSEASRMASVIPMGQPILVGHHSEKRDRHYREKIGNKFRKASEEQDRAAELQRRADASASNTAIFSDDPNAQEKLDEKIARLEKRQQLMVDANKCIRKKDRAGLAKLGFTEEKMTQLFEPDFAGRPGFPSYALQNNSANIRRLKERKETLQKKQEQTTSEETIGDVRIVQNVEDNRTQIFFPTKPAEAVRRELKSYGFRWSPQNNCWQRHLSGNATHWARQVVQKYSTPQSTQ